MCVCVCVCVFVYERERERVVRAQTLIRGIGHRLLNWRLMESRVFYDSAKNHFLRGDRKKRGIG